MKSSFHFIEFLHPDDKITKRPGETPASRTTALRRQPRVARAFTQPREVPRPPAATGERSPSGQLDEVPGWRRRGWPRTVAASPRAGEGGCVRFTWPPRRSYQGSQGTSRCFTLVKGLQRAPRASHTCAIRPRAVRPVRPGPAVSTHRPAPSTDPRRQGCPVLPTDGSPHPPPCLPRTLPPPGGAAPSSPGSRTRHRHRRQSLTGARSH